MNPGTLPTFGTQRPPVDPHVLARQILAEPRFRMHVGAASGKTWWDVVSEWLGARWTQLIEAFAQHVHMNAKAGAAAGDALLLIAVALVLITAIRLFANAARDRQIGGARVVPRSRPSADALFAQSESAARSGDYAHAVAILFRAAMVVLAVRGAVRDDPSRTVNECRRELACSAPKFQSSFDALAAIFTATLYAGVTPAASQWNGAREAFLRLQQADAA